MPCPEEENSGGGSRGFVNLAVIEVEDLTKTFGAFVAVDRLSFGIGEGEVFGLLGPNGAG